jgi:hypothetical protein
VSGINSDGRLLSGVMIVVGNRMSASLLLDLQS